MKKKIQVFDYAEVILKELQKGVLVTTKSNDRINSMTISWGALGVTWNKPTFSIYVREHRFTRKQLDEHGEFTVNVAVEDQRKLLSYFGTVSGYKEDKLIKSGVTLVNGDQVDVPGIKEFPLTLECKVISYELHDHSTLQKNYQQQFYKEKEDGVTSDLQYDHILYIGEIVNAYILEED